MTGKAELTGLILAGGAGRRAGGRDKGLIEWQGSTLVAQVAARLEPQVDTLLISCNRNFEQYAAIAPTTVADLRPDYQGPLAGLEAVARQVASKFLLMVPCDAPGIPLDLGRRLLEPLMEDSALQLSYAHDGERGQYLCALMRSQCLGTLPAYLDAGHRAVRHWYRQLDAMPVDFSDKSSAFDNLNELP